jgi:hypothetical protein
LLPKAEEILKSILRHGREIAKEFQKSKEIKSEHFITDILKG